MVLCFVVTLICSGDFINVVLLLFLVELYDNVKLPIIGFNRRLSKIDRKCKFLCLNSRLFWLFNFFSVDIFITVYSYVFDGFIVNLEC